MAKKNLKYLVFLVSHPWERDSPPRGPFGEQVYIARVKKTYMHVSTCLSLY